MSFHRASRIALTAISTVFFLSTPTLAAEPAAKASVGVQQKVRIADERPANINMNAPIRGAAPKVYEIRTPDASFVKVHFEHFNLPAGLVLEVSSPDGREVYRYSKTQRDGHTVERNSFPLSMYVLPAAALHIRAHYQRDRFDEVAVDGVLA